jgi:hypothetical protein
MNEEKQKLGTRPIDITVHLEVESQNVTDRMHWSKRAKFKKMWLSALVAYVGVRRSPSVKKTVTIIAYRKRLITDIANLIGGCKIVVDAIRDAKLIKDDSDQWAHINYVQHLASKGPAGKPCTIIRVESSPA